MLTQVLTPPALRATRTIPPMSQRVERLYSTSYPRGIGLSRYRCSSSASVLYWLWSSHSQTGIPQQFGVCPFVCLLPTTYRRFRLGALSLSRRALSMRMRRAHADSLSRTKVARKRQNTTRKIMTTGGSWLKTLNTSKATANKTVFIKFPDCASFLNTGKTLKRRNAPL